MANINLDEAQKLAPAWDTLSDEQKLSWVESEIGVLFQSNHPWNAHGYEDLMAARSDVLMAHRKILRNAIETARVEATAKAEAAAFTREVVGLRARAQSLANGATSKANPEHVAALQKAIKALQGVSE